MGILDSNIAKLPERLLTRTKQSGVCSLRLGRLNVVCENTYETTGLTHFDRLSRLCLDMQGNIGGRFRAEYVMGIAAYSKYNSNEDHPEGDPGKR